MSPRPCSSRAAAPPFASPPPPVLSAVVKHQPQLQCGGMGILFAHFDSASCNCEEHQCLRARDLQSATVRSRVSLSPPSSPFPSNLTCEEERAGESAGGSYGALPRAHPFGSGRPSRAEGDEVSTDSRDRSAWQHGITDRITHSSAGVTHARTERFSFPRSSQLAGAVYNALHTSARLQPSYELYLGLEAEGRQQRVSLLFVVSHLHISGVA